MGCNNCNDKPSVRHRPSVYVKGDVDKASPVPHVPSLENASPRPGRSFSPRDDMPSSPQEAFSQAKELSFDDIMKRQELQQRLAVAEIEKAYSEMTDAMRKFHVLSLLSVANYENLAMPGVNAEQAVVGLKMALDRKDFSIINDLYPTLKSQVEKRYEELVSRKIVL